MAADLGKVSLVERKSFLCKVERFCQVQVGAEEDLSESSKGRVELVSV